MQIFAAETDDLVANARSKLERKGVDFIVANDVSRADIGIALATLEQELDAASDLNKTETDAETDT